MYDAENVEFKFSRPRRHFNIMVSHYLLPYVLHPTRVTDHSSTVIDNTFSNITDFDTKSGNIFCDISDHFPQILIVDRTCPDYNSFSFAKHDVSHFDENKFVNDYSALDLRFLNDDDVSVDDKFASFYEGVSNLADEHVPSKKMTPKVVKLIRYRDRLKEE